MNKGRMIRAGVAGVLAAALVVPAAAYAIPGRGTPKFGAPKASADASRQVFAARKMGMLRNRITFVLQRRAMVFDATADRLGKRIARVETLAGKIADKGGDVTAVRAKLTEATSLLAEAKAAELSAVQLFKAVPDATDKKAAFQAARAQARTAAETLKKARISLRNAVLDLRAVANGLKGTVQ